MVHRQAVNNTPPPPLESDITLRGEYQALSFNLAMESGVNAVSGTGMDAPEV